LAYATLLAFPPPSLIFPPPEGECVIGTPPNGTDGYHAFPSETHAVSAPPLMRKMRKEVTAPDVFSQLRFYFASVPEWRTVLKKRIDESGCRISICPAADYSKCPAAFLFRDWIRNQKPRGEKLPRRLPLKQLES